MTGDNYRDLITDCLSWAARTRPGCNRMVLFELAKDWHRMALQAERNAFIPVTTRAVPRSGGAPCEESPPPG